ncbi:HlyD family secretion protein [Posidoniimonas corsicana]|uniref:HlyD family secretion protein n=1 Tax=Posidoniimonas corsicana TaxID=1938618 RepID=A0A5C5UW48_9BACT|nr:HlyD family efflux transporter periplasmic adaptor subunit [Posidoniimonas corsicana]TWT29585.1 HlyD family secretion protein [Posidoniimonas corsicana]
MATTPASRTNAPGSATAPRAAGDVWSDFAAELAVLTELARTADTAEAFYSEALRRTAAALAAEGGAVWSIQKDGRLRQVTLISPADRPGDFSQRVRHEELLASVAQSGKPRVLAANSEAEDPSASNPLPYTLIVAPVTPPRSEVAALIELMLQPGAAPSAYRGAEQLLCAVCEVAADHHTLSDLGELRSVCQDQRRLLTLAERVHGGLSLNHTAAAIANEARSAIGCGRVSVLERRGGGSRLLSISGVDRPDRRSRTLRGLQELAAVCCRLGDPLYLSEDQDEALPQASDALHRHADEANARQVAVVPLLGAGADEETPPIVGALVAENFTGADTLLARDRVAEVARICGVALGNALEHEATPLIGLTRSLRGVTRPSAMGRGAIAATALALAGAALLFVPAELRIDARGELQPAERRNIFAPGDGVVQQIAVEHGEQVAAGDLLIELRDPQLDLELNRIEGQRQTTQRQLEAVRATRSSIDTRSADRAEAYRLSAEEQQLGQRLKSLDAQRDLLLEQQRSLSVTSPVDGMVVTWELEDSLRGRPVERGQNLMSVADTAGEWRVELQLPDDRIGYLIDAQREDVGKPLQVEYRLGSQEEGFFRGEVARISERADAPARGAADGSERTIDVVVTPQAGDLSAENPEVRPGASVRARVLCGEHSLGYVLTHDLVNALRVWWEF